MLDDDAAVERWLAAQEDRAWERDMEEEDEVRAELRELGRSE